MSEITFGGVSPRSLGDLLKGYGIMAVVGEDCPEALFWWEQLPDLDEEDVRQALAYAAALARDEVHPLRISSVSSTVRSAGTRFD